MKVKSILFATTVCIFLLIPQRNAFADVGPKSSMNFDFTQNNSLPDIKIISAVLYVCDRSDCKDAHIVANPQYTGEREISCTDYQCYASLHGNFYQLEVTFSDDKTRKSNIFKQSFYEANYEVTIKEDSLSVQEMKGSNIPPFLFFGFLLFCPALLSIFLVVAIGTAIYTFAKKDGNIKLGVRLKNEIVWATIIFFIFAGMALNFQAYLFTILIECLLIVLYQRYLNLPYREFLLGVLLANLFTYPIFVFITMFFKITAIAIISGFELGIWLTEAVIVYQFVKQLFSFKKVLLLTFILNAISFGIGLFLPI